MNRKSIAVKLLIIMVLIIVLQAVLLIGSVLSSGVVISLQTNAYSSLNEKVYNRARYLQDEMTARFSDITSYAYDIINTYDDTVGVRGFIDDAHADKFLEEITPKLLTACRSTMSTGSFIILNNNNADDAPHSGVYLKDVNPILKSETNKDIYMLKGPVSVSRSLLIPLEKSWSYGITLTGNQRDIFDKPIAAANKSKKLNLLGCWNISSDMTENGGNMLTYSLPLVSERGIPFGVLGIDVSQDYLYKRLPQSELDSEKSLGYLIGKYDNNSNSILPVLSQGARQNQVINLDEPLQLLAANENYNCHYITNAQSNTPIMCNIQEIRLYNSNTPFDNEKWVLIGMVDESAVLGFSSRFTNTMSISFTVSIVIAIFVVLFAVRDFVKPIVSLAKRVRTNAPNAVASLGVTGLFEIDELSNAIVELNQNVINVSRKTDKIIGMVNLPLGTFEYKKGADFVTCSPNLCKILNLPTDTTGDQSIKPDIFFDRLSVVKQKVEDKENNIYMLNEDPATWAKIVVVDDQSSVFGVAMDVTREMLDNNAIKFERDYDGLTKIYNRIAFKREVENIFLLGVHDVAAFLMFDLDNLKYINDVYGHDIGDNYIKLAAQMLTHFMKENSVVGRMSGDEFYVFLYGFESKETILNLINQMYVGLDDNPLLLPNGENFKLRMSGGIAWYGENSCILDELIKFADFAMYQGKHNIKGIVREFDRESYKNEFFMLSGREELNKILDNQLIEFAFQPIISAKTGKIYAYESLMRPQSEVLATPLKLIQIAKSQSSLWKIEKLTFFKTLATYDKYSKLFNNCKIFINSVPNEKLKVDECRELERLYPNILKNVVIEIIENEKLDVETLTFKRNLIDTWGGSLALDDYGSGYNGDVSLLRIEPDIVKIDRLLIEGIENDRNRQSILQKLVKYGREQNVLILAEGVETRAELEKVISMGVDLLQGYYIAFPNAIPNFDDRKISLEIENIRLELEKSGNFSQDLQN